MTIIDKNKLYEKLEALGEQEVRENLALGLFGPKKIPLVKLWLDERDRRVSQDVIAKGETAGMVSTSGKISLTWNEIEKEYHVPKRAFGKRINFVKDDFKRKIIFRDIEQAHFLASNGFYKPAVILAGGVIEELLRLYLNSNGIEAQDNSLHSYIKACQEQRILKPAIHKLADSFREFRNLVHLEREESEKHTILRPTAKSAVASIFTITNDFEKSA